MSEQDQRLCNECYKKKENENEPSSPRPIPVRSVGTTPPLFGAEGTTPDDDESNDEETVTQPQTNVGMLADTYRSITIINPNAIPTDAIEPA
jgi:hypothetical protein